MHVIMLIVILVIVVIMVMLVMVIFVTILVIVTKLLNSQRNLDLPPKRCHRARGSLLPSPANQCDHYYDHDENCNDDDALNGNNDG